MALDPPNPGCVLAFTPVECLLGGVAVGTAVAAALLVQGRVLGISGTIKGLLAQPADSQRQAFLAGLLGGGALLRLLLPSAFDVLPPTFTVTRAVAAGALVGLGSGLGNGCTSGHGICGNARLSARSLVFTATFMAAGALSAALTNPGAALGIVAQASPLRWPSAPMLAAGAVLVTAQAAGFWVLSKLPSKFNSHTVKDATPAKSISLTTELTLGVTFAMGLGYSGMTRPSKVAGFLSITKIFWDPSLMFVMGGAIGVAVLPFLLVLQGKMQKPLVGSSFQLPSRSEIDARLLLGAVLFGVGWGAGGMCPGPALVDLAMPSRQGLAFVASMLAGLWTANAITVSK